MAEETRRQRLEKLRVQLEVERFSFESHWKDLADFIMPRRARFSLTDKNKGDARNQKIIDSTATYALRTLRSGMMSGITSPARPWFSLQVDGVNSVEPGPVHEWLDEVTQLMRSVFARTNLYKVLPSYYGDLGGLGTAAVYVEEDFENVMRFEIIPIGRYAVSKNAKGLIDTFSRNFMMTIRQLVDKFGEEAVSKPVRELWDRNRTEEWVEVVHIIEPNREYDPRRPESKFKQFSSVYYERSMSAQPNRVHLPLTEDKFLSDKGYDRFPVFVTSWETNGEDVYGTDCPGMTALGDIKQLQLGEKRSMQGIEKNLNPPLVGPSSLRNSPVSILPGDVNYVDIRDGQQGLRPVHEVRIQVGEIEEKQAQVRERIKRAFFEDLFLMLSQSDRREITAREIDERREEKLWALGPVLESLNQSFLDPLIDYAFAVMLKQGLIPEPPQELQGKNLKVEYVSVMAKAMKMIDLGGMDRFIQTVGGLASVDQSVLDKVDMDQVVDLYGSMTGIPAGVLHSDDETADIRERRAQQIRQQRQLDQMEQAASAAKDASQADMSGDNALTQALTGAGG